MKLQIPSEHLQKKLPFLNHAVSSKSQLPVLLNILLEASDNKLKLSATDLEIGIEMDIPAEVSEEGGITVSAKVFSELIASLPHEKITLQTKDTTLEVLSKKTKSVFQTIAKDEFPKLYDEKGIEVASLKKETAQADFDKVAFAASADMARPALSGILMKKDIPEEGEPNGLLLVATDGYRLSLKHQQSELKNTDSQLLWQKPLLIPARVLKEISLMKDGGSNISFYISTKNNQVLFIEDSTTLIGRLIEAEFPNYERIIPSEYSTRVVFQKDELQKAVKVCSIFARETANIVKFAVKSNAIIVSANTPSVGENTVEVEAQVQGEENEIAFNARYVLDILSHIDSEEMTFEMTGPLNPGVFKIVNDDSFLHLIMPIRVQS